MVKILQVFGRLDRGGAETIVMNYYRNINREEVQFDFIVHTEDQCAYEDEIKILGGRIFRLPIFKGHNYFQYKNAWRLFLEKHNDYSAIHAHMISTSSIYFPIAREFGIRTIAHSHNTQNGGGIEGIIKKIMHDRLNGKVDYYFACSEEAALARFGKNIFNTKQVRVLKNAVDIRALDYNLEVRQVQRRDLGFDDKHIVIGHIGRFGVVKNHEFLVKLFKELYKKNKYVRLILIGTGELEEEIRKKVSDMGLKEVVSFLGSRSDVNELLQAMDCFVFPSLFEGLPVTLIEAQAAGLPCVVSDKVTDEVKFTNKLKYIPLSSPLTEWANEVFKVVSMEKRTSTYSTMVDSGYDIGSQAKELQDFYLNKLT